MSKRKSKQFRGTSCLNCETALDISEKYCHQCGQLNSTKKLTIGDFFEEFQHKVSRKIRNKCP